MKKTKIFAISVVLFIIAVFFTDPVNILIFQSQVATDNSSDNMLDLRTSLKNMKTPNFFNNSLQYERYDRTNPFAHASSLQNLPLVDHDMSEKIHQSIVASTEKYFREQSSQSADYTNMLAQNYVSYFLRYCCDITIGSEIFPIHDSYTHTKENIRSYPVRYDWELTGALLSIAQTDIGRKFLLTFMTYYEKHPKTPKVVFFLGKNGGFFSGISFSNRPYYGIILPKYGPPEAVYNTADGRNITYLCSPRSAVLFHELTHLLHKLEDSAMTVRRFVSIDIAEKLFTTIDDSGKRFARRKLRGPFTTGTLIFHKKEYEDESWKGIKYDFCKNDRLLKELKAEFSNDEEFHTIFGFFKDKDGQIKRDIFCESAFTGPTYGYVRCGHWGPSNPKDVYLFNMMINHAIPQLYIDRRSDPQSCREFIQEELAEEEEWTKLRELIEKKVDYTAT